VVSERDKEYMRRIGQAEAEASAERLAEHRALSIAERLRRSLILWEQFRHSANLAGRVDDPQPFYERAKRLGLYTS
jgi:hypothetical protein